jgi:RTX calcium-binding nonapeptide repeat (4 copies)
MRKGALLGVVIGLLLPGAAHAASLDAVTMFSDGEWVGGGTNRLFTPANGKITVGGSTGDLYVGVSGGALGDSYSLEFAAPPGQVLAPGVYDKAQRAPFREAGRPGIDISGDGRGCNTVSGRFEVKDFAVAPEGVLERLWIVYEHHCEGGTAALFGEVRLGIDGGPGPVAVASSLVRWPPLDSGGASTAVPVTVTAAAPATIGSVTVAGAHPMDFPKRLDECSGRTLAAGDTCEVWMRFVPTVPGTRTARLRIPVGDVTHNVELQGFAYGGRTRVIMHSDPGDYIGQGRDWSYTPANATIAAGGTRQAASFGVDGANGDWWYGDFVAGGGDILVPGDTYQATRYPFNGSGPGMSVDGEGRGCNELSGTFTVTDARFEPDGRLRSYGIDFVQHCEHMTPALRGTFEFRAGDTTPLPPWMVSGPGSTGPNVDVGNPMSPPSPRSGAAPAPAAKPQGGSATGQAAPCTGVDARLVRGTRRANRLAGTRRGERIIAGSGRDRVLARGGFDCVDGGAGDDVLSGGSGRDLLYGGQGADVLAGGTARDRLYGGGGDDVLAGGAGRDRLDCGPGRLDVARGVRPGERVRRCERVTRSR